MSQFAPPPLQFAASDRDGKPPLVPMKPMLPAGVEQQKQQQPFWASSTTRRHRQQEPVPALPHPQSGRSGDAGEPAAALHETAAPAAIAEDPSDGPAVEAPHPAPAPAQRHAFAEPLPADGPEYSPHKRQRDGPGEFGVAEHGDLDPQHASGGFQPEYTQSSAAAAQDAEAVASARQRLQRLERNIAALTQQRAEARAPYQLHNFASPQHTETHKPVRCIHGAQYVDREGVATTFPMRPWVAHARPSC